MDGFLVLDSELIKVEVEENSNYHCIVCKAEFLERHERNEHLETHFVHRSCKSCSRPVIVIGDLEFELHHPTYCKQIEPVPPAIVHENVLEGDYSVDDDSNQIVIYKCKDAEEDVEIKDEEEEDALNVEFSQKTKRNQTKANSDDDETIKVLSILKPRKERLIQKAKQKTTKRNTTKCRDNPIETVEFNLDATNTESEDDVIKEMDVAMKKRRKQYAKLPKTLPCTMCNSLFGSQRTLKIHMHQLHGVKERYICHICQREFKISGNLKQHIETHSDHKRFICNYCGKGFHLPYNLKEHINTHTGARPYKCETCGKSFGRNTLRQAHMRVRKYH